MTDTSYTPPKVWQWNTNAEHRFSNINRPIAGPTHELALPIGKHPIQLYSLGTPNGVKVTIMLEELLALGKTEAEYDAFLINIGKGEQFSSGFVEVNPNSKIPAMLDRSTSPPTRIFESGAMLVYLAEKFEAFSADGGLSPGRVHVLVVLANGQCALPGRRLWPLLCLCAHQDRVLHRSLCHGG